jgi:hypothetical protein
MAVSLWFERIPAPITHAQAAVCGWDSPYAADSVVRYYQGRTLADWRRDTGDTADRVVISAGIGELILDERGTRFTPRMPGMMPPPGLIPAPPTLIAARLEACRACERWRDDRCTVAGCACSGMGRPEWRSSRCPLERW